MKRIIKYIVLICFIALNFIYFVMTLEKADENFQKTIDNYESVIYNKDTEIEELKTRVKILQEELEDERAKEKVVYVEKQVAMKGSGNIIPIRVTHYSAEEASGTTASGTIPVVGRTIACNFLPLGTHVIIDGYEYVVEDTGGMAGDVVDIFVSSYDEAISRGTYYTEMEIL